MITTYNYSVTPQFDINNLTNNIYKSVIISTQLITISIKNENLEITFENNLSSEEEIELSCLINNNICQINKSEPCNHFNIVKIATTTSGDLNNSFKHGEIIDGVELKKMDIILIKDQINKIENGIYTINLTDPPSRINFDYNKNCGSSLILVNQGENNANTIWLCSNNLGSDIIGINELEFIFYGNTGPTGPIGLTGPTGPTGPIGLTGPTGPISTNTSYSVSSSTIVSTISSSYILIPEMYITPLEGTYYVSFSGSFKCNNKNQIAQIAIYYNDIIIDHSEREFNNFNEIQTQNESMHSIHTQSLITTNGLEKVEIKYKSNESYILDSLKRNLILIKVS